MHLQLDPEIPGERYYYDPVAAEKPINLIGQYCCHIDGPSAGDLFDVIDFQKQWFRDIWGWKRHADNLRRFREVFLECPKGQAKSMWLTFCGLVELLIGGENGAHIVSAATDFKQANITFDAAKQIIRNSPRLIEMVEDGDIEVIDKEIRYLPTNSKWTVMSGDFSGKAGFKFSMCLLDEAWEWHSSKMYDSLTRNCTKRAQPLVIVATNSGNRKDTVCWSLHERALKVLNGTAQDDTLYPVVYCTDENDDPSKRDTWVKANPALDKIASCHTETLEKEWLKCLDDPAKEPEFRRLHCGQWVLGGVQTYLDMTAWRTAVRPFTRDELRKLRELPAVMGWDQSLVSDLTALVTVWIGDDVVYVRPKFWLPEKTAKEFQEKAAIPYDKWAKKRHIKLIDAETIDPRVQQSIADYVIRFKQHHNLRAFCYDKYKAGLIVNILTEAGVDAIDVPQGYYLSPTLEEISRLLKDRSIVIAPNDVMDFCAQNTEVQSEQGRMRLRKESATGKYKGNKNYKIDGVQALATAMHQVRLETMQPREQWTGGVWLI